MNSKYLVRRLDPAPYSPDNDIGTRILRLIGDIEAQSGRSAAPLTKWQRAK